MKTSDAEAAYKQALLEHQAARRRFDQADPAYVDAAIADLRAAELKLSAARMRVSLERVGEAFGGAGRAAGGR